MKFPLLPEKHVWTSESLIGLGAVVLLVLEEKPKTIDTLWADVKDFDAVKGRIHGTVTLDSVVLAIDFLFTVGAVTLSSKGFLAHASA